jgi:hypothetical protein
VRPGGLRLTVRRLAFRELVTRAWALVITFTLGVWVGLVSR